MKVRLWVGGQGLGREPHRGKGPGWGKRDSGSGFSPRRSGPWVSLAVAQGYRLEFGLCSTTQVCALVRGSICLGKGCLFLMFRKASYGLLEHPSSLVDRETEAWAGGRG